jgi:hypothetical protein
VASVASNAPEFRAVSAAVPLALSSGPRFGCWYAGGLHRPDVCAVSAAAPWCRCWALVAITAPERRALVASTVPLMRSTAPEARAAPYLPLRR